MSEESGHHEISDPAVMAAQPLVSVHMLAYRHERFLAQAIEGVAAQLCDFPIELIIAEDCSPDGTLAIALEYQRRHPRLIRVITGEKNVGMHANAGRTMPAVRGKYVAFCEGDDYWQHPYKLQMQVDSMSAKPGTLLCHTDFDLRFRFQTKHNYHRMVNRQHLAQGNAFIDLLHDWTVMTATSMYLTDTVRAFATSPFAEPTWPFGDYNLALFAAANGPVAYIPISTATWRRVAGSATNRSIDQYLAMALSYAECRERFLNAYPVTADVAHSVRVTSHISIMKRAFVAGRIDVFESSLSWLCQHAKTPNVMVTGLQRFALRRNYMMRCLQVARNFYRSLKLLGS